MFIRQTRLNNMKDRITNLEGQVEALLTQKLEERNKKMIEIGNLDDKIVILDKDKRKLQNDIEDIESKKTRSIEEIEHKVKIVMEKNELELVAKKQEVAKEYDDKVVVLTASFRDKREKQLEALSDKMEGHYKDMLKHLTTVSGTVNKPSGVQENGNSN